MKKLLACAAIALFFFSMYPSDANAFYLWRYREDATDCTALTDGKVTDLCYEIDSDTFYKCEPTAGDCSGSEWRPLNTTGNASTASALAANGGNCSAGEYPLGVDASGAVESCTDATTEIAAYAQPLDSDLTDLADGSLTASKVAGVADADYGDVSVSSGTWSVDANSVALGTDTTGNYVATIADSGASEVTVANSGTETAAVTLAIASGITRDTEWDTEGEVQTAWGSVDILLKTEADGYYQPLESTLTDIADGTIAENLVNTANPWADNEVADDITASSYLPLAGGTMTGELKIDETGIEGQPTDALTDCSTFSATGGGIFYDDSEGQWKKCEDNVLSDLDTGGGGGDSVSIDGAGVTDPDFVSTGQIDFVDTSNTVTANINDNSILEADLKAVDSATDEDILTYESTTGDFEWHTEDEIIATMSAGGLPNDSILEADLKAVDAASDEECLTYETTTGDFEWQACGSGSGTTEYILPIYSAKITGTFALDGDATQGAQIDAGDGNWRLLFDATTDEGAVWQGIVPENFASVGVVDIDFSMTSGESNEVQFEAAIMCYTPGTDTADVGTASFATLGEGSATTVSATAGEVYRQSVTLTDDSCAAGDDFWIYVSTDADDVTNDDATGDREVIGVKWNYA